MTAMMADDAMGIAPRTTIERDRSMYSGKRRVSVIRLRTIGPLLPILAALTLTAYDPSAAVAQDSEKATVLDTLVIYVSRSALPDRERRSSDDLRRC